jgi:3-isopropylmalate/(R)-2-methylmalate dehydratase small subunit
MRREAEMREFGGRVLFLDRSDINTDEIIPAKYLTKITKEEMGPHLLEDLNMEGFDPTRDIEGKAVIVSRANFGCGSSREHAPWALEANGINLVIAKSFARIFRQNIYNCGMLAVELSQETIDHLFNTHSGYDTIIALDLEKSRLKVSSEADEEEIPFTLSEFDRLLVRAGGWVNYADEHY